MKKLMMLTIGAMFLVAGCEENKTAEKAPEAAPAATAQEAAAAPAMAPAPLSKKVEMKSVDWAKAKEMKAAGALYVDVRNPSELNEGYAPEAINIPLGVELKNRINELPKDKDLLIYCRSGRRSEAATKFLMDNGYERVYNVLGGFLAYPKD